MPKTKFQEVIFTIIMVFFMVYAMICYNTALNIGEMKRTFVTLLQSFLRVTVTALPHLKPVTSLWRNSLKNRVNL